MTPVGKLGPISTVPGYDNKCLWNIHIYQSTRLMYMKWENVILYWHLVVIFVYLNH